MEEMTKGGAPGDDNGEKREGHGVDDKNLQTGMLNEVKETDTECVDQEKDTEVKVAVETESSDNVELSPLLHLPWDDIMLPYLLPFLRYEDLFRLRATCFDAKCLVDTFFQKKKEIDLSIVQCKFNGEAMKVVTANCTQLRSLIIQRGKWLTDKDIIPVFKQNKDLEYLDLTECENLTGTCILALAVNCKKLKTLALPYCVWLNRGAVETLIAHTDYLENVDFSGCSGLCHNTVVALVQKFKLKQLKLTFIYQSIDDSTMIQIARECGDTLECLDVSGCFSVTDVGVKMVAEYCQNLKTLHVASNFLVTNDSLHILRERGVELYTSPEIGDSLPTMFCPFVQV